MQNSPMGSLHNTNCTDSSGNNDAATANYTLPGIMHYLQNQFTQVERNRLQGELERSSLKLKIIELENDRNSLMRQNERLEIIIERLNSELEELKAQQTVSRGDGKGQSVSINGKDFDKNDELLKTVGSVDVSNLVHARKFLKSATNEILYLLKTPTIELDNTSTVGSVTGFPSLSGDTSGSDLFFSHSAINNSHSYNLGEFEKQICSISATNPELNKSSNSKGGDEQDLNPVIAEHFQQHSDVQSDAETIVDEGNIVDSSGVGSAEDDGDEEDDDDDEFDDDDDDDEFDDDDDDDEYDEDNQELDNESFGADSTDRKSPANAIRKPNTKPVLKVCEKSEAKEKVSVKSTKKPSSTMPSKLSIHLENGLSEMELKSGKLFLYYDQQNVVKVYENLLGKSRLIKEVYLPPSDEIVDIVTNEKWIIIATTSSLLAYTLDVHQDQYISQIMEGIKSIDLEEDRVLLVLEDQMKILDIDFQNNQLNFVREMNHKCDGIIKKGKFIKMKDTFDIAILSSTTLYLYNSSDVSLYQEAPLSMPTNNSKFELQSQFHEWLLTSKNLILRFDKNMFLLDFNDCTNFKRVPLPESAFNDGSEVISSCVDDESMFYITKHSSDEKSQHLFLFKSTKTGEITQIKEIKNITRSERFCLGKLSNKFALFIAKNESIHVHNVIIH